MSFETAGTLFMLTGTLLFSVILFKKHLHKLVALLLAATCITWGVLAYKYWGPTFPPNYSWVTILLPITGMVSAVTALTKFPASTTTK